MSSGDSRHAWPFPTKGNRCVPSFMRSAFVNEPDEAKGNDDWSVKKGRAKDLTVDRFLVEPKDQNKRMETSDQESNQWPKCSCRDSTFNATASGDTKHSWPFPMKGNRYVPSFMLSAFVEGPGEKKNNDYLPVRKRKTKEKTVDKFLEEPEEQSKGDQFEEMLKSLSSDRDQIINAKKFTLDNVDSAGVIVDALTKSFATKGTPMRIMIARLTLLSNILYSRNLTYQARFEAVLPCIMLNFHDLLCNIEENLVSEILKGRVLQFLHDWGS